MEQIMIDIPLKIDGRARVQVTLEIQCAQWGDDCSIGQLHRQASAEALAKVRSIISNANDKVKVYGVSIVGEPMVIAVLTEEKR